MAATARKKKAMRRMAWFAGRLCPFCKRPMPHQAKHADCFAALLRRAREEARRAMAVDAA